MTEGLPKAVSDKLWTKYYIIAMFVSLAFGICSSIHMTTLPLYALHIGGDKSVAGLLTGLFSFSALLFRPFWGKLIDIRGRKIILLAGIMVTTLVSFAYSFAYAVVILLVLRFIHGIGMSAQSTSTGTIVADLVPASRLMEGIGYFGVSNILATAIGPALGLYLIDIGGFKFLYLVTFAISVLGLAIAMFINYEKDGIPTTQQQEKIHHVIPEGETAAVDESVNKRALFEKSALAPALVMLFVAFAMSSVISFLPLYAISKNINNIGMFFTVYAAALLVSRLFSGRLTDRYGVTIVFIPGIAIFIISLVIIAISTSLQILLCAAILYGLGSGTLMPILNGITIRLSPLDRRGAANATFFASIDIGMGVGSIVWGFVSQYEGFSAIYFGAAAVSVISVLLYVFILRRKLNLFGKVPNY